MYSPSSDRMRSCVAPMKKNAAVCRFWPFIAMAIAATKLAPETIRPVRAPRRSGTFEKPVIASMARSNSFGKLYFVWPANRSSLS